MRLLRIGSKEIKGIKGIILGAWPPCRSVIPEPIVPYPSP